MKFARATYRNDLLRAPFMGILEAGWTTFALVIAIRYFDASETHKAFIAGAGPIGFLLTPITLYFAANLRASPNRACVFVFGAAALLLVGASLAQRQRRFGVAEYHVSAHAGGEVDHHVGGGVADALHDLIHAVP